MIPLRSSERNYTPSTVTLVLIGANVLVFLYELSLGLNSRQMNHFIAAYGIVPDELRPVTILTSMFIHGGWLHILGNMWFLWIFGRGVEDVLGHAKYLIFYFACGIAAGLVHIIVNANSPVPTVGASGAIAGVMGAYLIKFPSRPRGDPGLHLFLYHYARHPRRVPAAVLVRHSVLQRCWIARILTGIQRRRGLVRPYWRIPGRHGSDYVDGAQAAALSAMVLKCFSR